MNWPNNAPTFQLKTTKKNKREKKEEEAEEGIL